MKMLVFRNIKLDCLVVFKESGWGLKRKVMEGHISKTRHSQNMFWTRHHCILTPKRILISVTTRCSLKENSYNGFNLNPTIETLCFLLRDGREFQGILLGHRVAL